MNTTKMLILDRIRGIDNDQAERVLRYLTSILNEGVTYGPTPTGIKQKAIREIRSALANQNYLQTNW